jgi:hypothetical protein
MLSAPSEPFPIALGHSTIFSSSMEGIEIHQRTDRLPDRLRRETWISLSLIFFACSALTSNNIFIV